MLSFVGSIFDADNSLGRMSRSPTVFYFCFSSSVFITRHPTLSEICIFRTVNSASCLTHYAIICQQLTFSSVLFLVLFFLVSAMISVLLVGLLVSRRLHQTLLTHRPGHLKSNWCIRGGNVFKYGCLIIITMMTINVLYRQKRQSRLCSSTQCFILYWGPECQIWLDSSWSLYC